MKLRALLAILATTLYAGIAVGVPILHAQTEVVSGEQGVEAEHSETCPRLHTDTGCPTVSGQQLPRATVRHVPVNDLGTRRVHAVSVTPLPDHTTTEATPPVRAPPRA